MARNKVLVRSFGIKSFLVGDDIISRLRSITMTDLEQKADLLPTDYSLAIESVPIPTGVSESLTVDQASSLLEPSLRVLRDYTNMKPHQDNGLNQNGIYYNTDYFRLYLAFEQFQKVFQVLFPSQVVELPQWTSEGYVDPGNNTSSSLDRDRDRDRNSNMKAYRIWIEPLLAETNWAAFRRNIVVGERMMQLSKVIGQGVLLMTKELSGSKLHLTFTNNEWEEFITGLCSGRWDQTIQWEHQHPSRIHIPSRSVLVAELRTKLLTRFWFYPDGRIVPSEERRKMLASEVSASS
ncbi:hypothetical protein BX666DRAFT_1863165 [Dichotomocladium elegans]|nr:hypothetical protein BX666DRAFT_1863165 [Dichotomocladium elegans]